MANFGYGRCESLFVGFSKTLTGFLGTTHPFLASFLVILRSFLHKNGNLKSMNELSNWCGQVVAKVFWIMVIGLSSTFTLLGQAKDKVLFEVDGVPVYVSEFTYIYDKTNGQKADYSRKSLDEYLDLYVKFKLKVRKAKSMQLDTIQQLKQELAGYRKQLADSYLLDKTVVKTLAKEVHDRKQQDVDLSHILVALGPNPQPKDTLEAYQKAMAIKKRLASGAKFEEVAKEASEDRSAKKNAGRIGFITAMLPPGMYELESLAYEGEMKKVLGPVRTNAGYHLVRVNDRRKAFGEVEVAHLLIRNTEDNPSVAKAKIDSIYQALRGGASFEDLVRVHSEDGQTKSKNGYIGFVGINRFAKVFENAMFGIAEDGGYSQPFQSNIGWHIVKRISRPGIQPFEQEKSRLEQAVSKDSRLEVAKAKMLAKLKKQGNYRENTVVYDRFVNTLNDTFLNFRWRPNVADPEAVLFTMGKDFQPTLGEFADYLRRNSRDRMRMARSGDVKGVARSLFNQFVDEQVLKFEESQLENNNPDFKALMREYEEGILLFEATKMLVWDKASQDTVGLEKFFKGIDGKYKWRERANVEIYRMSKDYEAQAKAIRDYAMAHTAEEVKAKFNVDNKVIVNVEEKRLEKGRHPQVNRLRWKAGVVTELDVNDKSNTISFTKILSLLPPSNKTLKEARGYIVADYQDHLEREWIKELKKEYKVKVNDAVYKSLIKE